MWIQKNNETFEITGYNTAVGKDGQYELWGTRKTGKTILLKQGNEKEIYDLQTELEFGIIKGEKLVSIL